MIRPKYLPAKGNLTWPLIAGYILFCILYLGAGHAGLRNPLILEPSGLDRSVPFLSWTVLIYLTQFLILPCSFVFSKDDQQSGRSFVAMMIATVISCAIFLILPTRIPRDSLPIADDSLREVWLTLFNFDPDTNCFPSLHVALASLAAWGFSRNGKVPALLFAVWAIAITFSTLTTKQHLAIDVAGGWAVAAVSAMLACRLVK